MTEDESRMLSPGDGVWLGVYDTTDWPPRWGLGEAEVASVRATRRDDPGAGELVELRVRQRMEDGRVHAFGVMPGQVHRTRGEAVAYLLEVHSWAVGMLAEIGREIGREDGGLAVPGATQR